MKFINLFKKELKEMVTIQLVIGLAVSFLGFYILGNFMKDQIDEADKDTISINICNKDTDKFTSDILDQIHLKGNTVNKIEISGTDYEKELEDKKLDSLIVIPENFSQDILSGKKPEMKLYTKVKSLSMFDNLSRTSNSQYIDVFKSAISTVLMSQKFSKDNIAMISDPFTIDESTTVKDKTAKVSGEELVSYLSSQTSFVPIIVFLLIMFATQMIISAISTEKIDKTLETLLSTPVSRASVLSSKMLAATTVGGIYAIVFMVAYKKFMGGLIGNAATSSSLTSAVKTLGLEISSSGYIMIGIQLFLSIMIALCIALVLGALAKDVKSAQTVVFPLTIALMIPYFVSIFTDINGLSILPKTLIGLIPFTHSFTAFTNVTMGNTAAFWGGALYQLAFLAVCMYIAIRVFMTDKIFTMSLNFGKKKKVSD